LLNTSFNNNVEPIVNSIEDAVVCYLTTNLDYLIVGDYLIKRKSTSWQDYLLLKPLLAPYLTLNQGKKSDSNESLLTLLTIRNTFDTNFSRSLSPEMYRILCLANGEQTLKDLVVELRETDDRKMESIVLEAMDLWSQRLVTLS
jgi:carbamoyltransferase